jgi:hypothetical protein
MALQAALGFKLHTGWAAMVALSGNPGKVQLHLRQRIELLPSDNSIPRFVYHEASERTLAEAKELVRRARKASMDAARLAVEKCLQELGSRDVKVGGCGVLSGSAAIPGDLSTILRSHPLIHAAEGALFQEGITVACESYGLIVLAIREREVWARAAFEWSVAESALRREMDALRKSAGAPWSADQKLAAAIALVVLKSQSPG